MMCDCNLIANGEFTPIIINENKLSFSYIDKYGIKHVLINEFKMNISISKAKICEVKDVDGKIIAYQFTVE